MKGEIKQEKTFIEVVKLELEKRYQEIIENIKRKTAATKKKTAAQAEIENAEAQAKNENATAEVKS